MYLLLLPLAGAVVLANPHPHQSLLEQNVQFVSSYQSIFHKWNTVNFLLPVANVVKFYDAYVHQTGAHDVLLYKNGRTIIMVVIIMTTKIKQSRVMSRDLWETESRPE